MKILILFLLVLIFSKSALAITENEANIKMNIALKAYECAELDWYANDFEQTKERERLLILAFDSIEIIAPAMLLKYDEILNSNTENERLKEIQKEMQNLNYIKGFLIGRLGAESDNNVKKYILDSDVYSIDASISVRASILYRNKDCHILGR